MSEALFFCCGFVVVLPRRGYARHRTAWLCYFLEQFVMCLETTWFVTAFYPTSMHDPGPEESQRPIGVCVCKGALLELGIFAAVLASGI